MGLCFDWLLCIGTATSGAPRICILGGGFGGLYTAVRLQNLLWPQGKKPLVTFSAATCFPQSSSLATFMKGLFVYRSPSLTKTKDSFSSRCCMRLSTGQLRKRRLLLRSLNCCLHMPSISSRWVSKCSEAMIKRLMKFKWIMLISQIKVSDATSKDDMRDQRLIPWHYSNGR